MFTPNLLTDTPRPTPYLTAQGELILPFGTHPRYHWWTRRQWFVGDAPLTDNESVLTLPEILWELNATPMEWVRYTNRAYLDIGVSPDAYQKEIDVEYNAHQVAIIDHCLARLGPLVVEAGAGCAKTTTLVAIVNAVMAQTPYEDVRVLAFNKDIALTLQRKLPRGTGAKACTIHSFGYEIVRRYWRPANREDYVDSGKYWELAKEIGIVYGWNPRRHVDRYTTLVKVADLCRTTLVNPCDLDAFAGLLAHYGMELPDGLSLEGLQEATVDILEDGKKSSHRTIDYTDMLWLPNVIEMDMPQVDMLLVDESQDLAPASREIILQVVAGEPHEQRLVFVGDPNQSCYGFAGADPNSMRIVREKTQATVLPLMYTYRCPKAVVRLANRRVPGLMAAPGAIEGKIGKGHIDKLYVKVPHQDGDMILSRTTSPLIALFFRLVERNIPATVLGRDIGKQLSLEALKIGTDIAFTDFPLALQIYQGRAIVALADMHEAEMQIEAIMDRCASLSRLYVKAFTSGITDLSKFIDFIESLFSDEKGSVTLSTIHKAKGLEADRVFLLKHKIPHPKAKTDWEMEQEENLRHIAITRTKRELYIVSGAEDL